MEGLLSSGPTPSSFLTSKDGHMEEQDNLLPSRLAVLHFMDSTSYRETIKNLHPTTIITFMAATVQKHKLDRKARSR